MHRAEGLAFAVVEQPIDALGRGVALAPTTETTAELVGELSEAPKHGLCPALLHADNRMRIQSQARSPGSPRTKK
jgi:hypothetical protein